MQREEKQRTNRTWMCIVETRTREEGNYAFEVGGFVKFDLPEVLPNGKVLENTKSTAIWFYLNALDQWSTMSNDRMFNGDDINPKEILDLASLKKPHWEKQEESNAS